MPVNIGKAIAYLELDTSKFTQGFSKAAQEMKVFQSSTATVTQKMNGLASASSIVGGALTKGVTVPLAAIGTASVKVSMDFEKAMSSVKAITGSTGKDFENLRQEAIDLGSSTTFSATEVANAMTEMAKAGWDSQQIMDGMAGVLDAAAASGEELATVSTIVADAITGFGLSASDSARVADLLTQAANAGTISVSDLGETFKYIAPVANTMGFSIEDVTTAVTAMSQAGIKGSQAGTSLRGMMTRLVKPTDAVKTAMDELNIEIANSDGTFKSLDTILAEMRESFKDLTPEQQTYYAAVLAGQEGVSGLTALLGIQQEEYDKISASMENASGVAEETAEVMQDNLAGAVEQLGGTLESAGITIGSKLTPKIKSLTKMIDSAVDTFNNMDEEQQEMIINFGLTAAAIGPVMLAGSKLIPVITGIGKGATTVIKELNLFRQALKANSLGMTEMAMQSGKLFSGLTSLKSGLLGLANPATAVIGLATAGIALTIEGVKQQKQRIQAIAEETEAEKFLTEAIHEQYEASQQAMERVQESIDSANAEAAATENLWQKLQSVTDENGKVLEGKQSYAEFIVGELSDALGQEISLVDGQIEGYEELADSIDETIEKQKALAYQEAIKEDYTEAIQNQAKAQQQYGERLIEVAEKEQEAAEAKAYLDQVQEELTQAQKDGTAAQFELTNEYDRASEAYYGSLEALDNAKESLSEATDSMENWNSIVQNYEGLSAAIIEGDAETINEAMLKIQEGFLTAETATKESLEQQVQTIQTKYQEMADALEQGAPGVTQEMVDQMEALAIQANEELANKLEMDKQTMTTKFAELGFEAPQALINSLTGQDPILQQQILTMFSKMKNNTQLNAEELTTLFNNLGIDAPTSLINQMSALEPSAQAQATNLLMQLKYAEASSRPGILSQFKSLGINVDDSLAGGMQSNQGAVEKQGATVGKAGNKSIQKNLEKKVKSPDMDDNVVSSGEGQVRAARRSMQSILDNNPLSAIIRTVTGGTDGSHAGGLAYVPFDGYIAELHKGERVLTAEENREYMNGRMNGSSKQSQRSVPMGGDTFVFYSTKDSPYEYARKVKQAKKELILGF